MSGSVVHDVVAEVAESNDSGTGIPSQTLSIYLFKEDTTWDQVLREDAGPFRRMKIPGVISPECQVIVKLKPRKTPHWKRLAESCVGAPIWHDSILGSSCLIAISVEGRLFAVPFGSADSWVDEARIVRGFGRIAALNASESERIPDSERLRLMEFDAGLQREDPLGLNGRQLRSVVRLRTDCVVSGHPRDQGFSHRAVGADNLIIDGPLDLRQLRKKCGEALTYFLPSDAADSLSDAMSAEEKELEERGVRSKLPRRLWKFLVPHPPHDEHLITVSDAAARLDGADEVLSSAPGFWREFS